VFKRQQNESPYSKSVTVTETVWKKGRLLERFRKNCHNELHEKATDGLVVDVT
jgi:hypothetical protein